LNPQPSDP